MLRTGMLVQITGSHTRVLAFSIHVLCSSFLNIINCQELLMYLYYGRTYIICIRHVRENKLTGLMDNIPLSNPQLVEFMTKDLKQNISLELKIIQPHACHGSPEKKSLTAFHSICEKSTF